MNKSRLVFFLFLLFPVVAMAETPGDAISLALQHSSDLEAAGDEIRAAELEVKAAKLAFLPAVGVGSSYMYNSADAEIDLPFPGSTPISLVPEHSYDINGNIQWLAFGGFSRSSGLDLRKLGLEMAKTKEISTRTQIALETLVYYRQVQNAMLQLDTLASGRDRLSLKLKQLEAMRQQGMASAADIISIRLSLLEYEQQITGAESRLENASRALNEKTGKDITVRALPGDLPDLEFPEFRIPDIPAITVLQQSGDRARIQARLERSAMYPKLVINSTAHYGRPGANPSADEWMFYFTAGASISWNTDWGAAEAKAKAAEARGDSIDKTREETVGKLKLDFDNETRTIRSGIEALDMLREARELTGEQTGITEKQYAQGMATISDFTDATLAETQAELRYKSQILVILLKLNQLEAMSGTPIENWSVTR